MIRKIEKYGDRGEPFSPCLAEHDAMDTAFVVVQRIF